MRIGKLFMFEAAHYIPGHPKCGEIHGHSYKLEVVIEGQISSKGMLIDFHDVKEKVNKVLKNYDHHLLNDMFDTPTVERIAISLYNEIKQYISNLQKIKLWETTTSYAEYEGK